MLYRDNLIKEKIRQKKKRNRLGVLLCLSCFINHYPCDFKTIVIFFFSALYLSVVAKRESLVVLRPQVNLKKY